MKRALLLKLALSCAGISAPVAQMRVAPLDQLQGHAALGLALRHLSNVGIFMMATAHPDDENNALLVQLNRGQGVRTALVTATRGNGGQNEIGPEIFEALGVLRSEELAAIHRFDGAEQYFARAVDFGFSFSIEETFEKWGRDEILGDLVRLIRMVRPDVVTGLWPTGGGGGQHHQASAILAREAFKAAADPARYPDQIKAGLRPWQPRKFYFSVPGFGPNVASIDGGGKTIAVNLAGYDRLLGRTYAEIGTEARSMHKCQGMAQLLSLPGPSSASYQLVETTLPGGVQRADTALFDGVDTSVQGLARFAGAKPPKELVEGLAAVAAAVQNAQRRFDTEGTDAAVLPLLTGLRALRTTRGLLGALPIDDMARFEIRFRLLQKEREFQQAILLASSIRLEALAADGVVVPGQQVRVAAIVANRGLAEVTVKQVKFDGFQGEASCTLTAPGGGRGNTPFTPPASGAAPLSVLKRDQVGQCSVAVTVPPTTRISEPYWRRAGEAGRYTIEDEGSFGLPYTPTPFYAQVTLSFAGGDEVYGGLAVTYRYDGGDVFSGEKRSELLVVPPFSVRMSPEVLILPLAAPVPPPPAPPTPPAPGRGRGVPPAAGTTGAPAGRGRGSAAPPVPPPPAPVPMREIRVTVVNDLPGPAENTVKLEAPAGWTVTPPTQGVSFTREDEAQTVRFQVRAAPGASPGEYRVKASAASGSAEFTRGFQVVEYPHIRRQHLYRDAQSTVRLLDVKTTPNLTVGYIMGVGDEVPAAIEQLGVKVELVGAEDLAWGNLSRFPTIVTGVRAYERRADLRAHNSRLLDYVRDGGTLIVQYNKFEFNEAQYGPFQAKVSADRVTDEFAPVTLLVPGDPVFNTPNRITDAAWKNWVQERGLYFLGEHDSRYRELISIAEPFPNNKGEKTGALVSAQYGKGRWVYLGLALWRELPAGVEGAYLLLANLVSLNR
jgi:LmbE family N-acetylglucosaminyl deacetylase